MKVFILLLSSVFSSVTLAEEMFSVSLDRAWGLLLGDEVNVRVDLSSTLGNIDISSLPQSGKRYGTWLYLKEVDVTSQYILLTYQIVNVPTVNTSVTTPEFNIKQGDKWKVIPALVITIGPLLVTNDKSGLDSNMVAKPDLSAILIATNKSEQQLALFSVIALLSSTVLALWHFGWKSKNRHPFAQAVHELSRLRWQGLLQPEQATRILHAAFNRTAGSIVVYGELDTMLQQQSWLMPLKNDIDRFYKRSEEHFFTRQAGQEPDLAEVRALAKACRNRERLA